MTAMSQPDLHPDADLLNAFVERALPAADRTQIVAHLAGCARCREVVYLAQAAAEPEIAPVAVVEPQARPGWFSEGFAKWRVALIPAAALAAVGAVVFWVQLQPAPPEMAKLAPQSAPVPATTDSTASQKVPRQTAPLGLSAAAKPAQAGRPPQAGRIPSREPKKAPASSSGVVGLDQLTRSDREAGSSSAPLVCEGRPVEGIHLDGRSASMARFQSPAQPASSPQNLSFTPPAGQTVAEQRSAQAIGGPALTSNAAPAPAPTPHDIIALHGTALPPSAGESPEVFAGPPQALNEPALFQLAKRAKLPSGLKTVSSAAMLNRLVAVDSEGSVFLSQDAGRHWESVFPQWSGRALQVLGPPPSLYRLSASDQFEAVAVPRLSAPAPGEGDAGRSAKGKTPVPQPAASNAPPPVGAPLARTAIPAPAPATAKAPPIPANPALPTTLFKLVTDRHQVWVSADGKVWREQ